MFNGLNLIRAAILLFTTIIVVVMGYVIFGFVNTRLTDNLRAEANNRGTILAGILQGDLQRHMIVPRILDRDDRVAISFFIPDPSLNAKLSDIASELDNSQIYTVNPNGQIGNASQVERIGKPFEYVNILERVITVGSADYYNANSKIFYSARRITDPITNIPLGMVVIEVDFKRYQDQWNRLGVNMILTRSSGDVLLASRANFSGGNLYEIFSLDATKNLEPALFDRVFSLDGEDTYVSMIELALDDWKLVVLSSAQEISDLMGGYIAFYILAVSSLVLFGLYVASRRAALEGARARRESEELRALNSKLITEIEQRQKVERSLQTAEQSLEQSSKLAVIGQMSAAIGHELNQPLAAMRTYIAGVRALLRRSRFVEAGHNINKIEDLLDRMGSITRQMRAFARAPEKHEERFDLRESIQNSFELMIPQLGQAKIKISREIETDPVWVRGDRIRVEQILVNLMRNAIEATGAEDDAFVKISLVSIASEATVTIADNGVGFDDVEKLFEPFYTTKAPGEGLGLGLAISAQYARDMGGNLLARANSPKGAIFELKLPRAKDT